MNLEELQRWEIDFAKRKGVPQDYETALKIATLKLSEETGEVCRGILKEDWENVQEECFDVLSFLCKITYLMQEFHGARNWTDVCRDKIATVEQRGNMNPKTHRMRKTPREKGN
ncbi:MAG: MazG-like family protein [Candidatus Nanoperiomorbaceae bacterium]